MRRRRAWPVRPGRRGYRRRHAGKMPNSFAQV